MTKFFLCTRIDIRSLRDPDVPPDVLTNDYSKEYSGFIVENIIIANQQSSDVLTYELSLFGVMLTLLILLYNDMKKLKHGLYIKKYPLKKYCDIISYNYSQKLPLIFGKWNRLRQILQVSTIYNFDAALLHTGLLNNDSNSLSVITRGNQEIFEGIRKILQYNKSLMQDLLNAGLEVLKDYFLVRFDLTALERLKDDTTFRKMNLICAMIEEMMILLNPLWYRYPRLSLITLTTLDPNKILTQMEEYFADEISVFYYMNLLKPNIDISEMKMRHNSAKSKNLNYNLERSLLLLVQEIKGNPLVENWIKVWSQDLASVYHDIDETVKAWSLSTIFC